MQFHVTDRRVWDTSTQPKNLSLPYWPSARPQAARTTRHMKLQMTRDKFGIPTHILNNRRFDDPIEHKPQLGSTEIWKLENNTMHTHPIHLHLVEFEVIGRGPDGQEPPHPNERGGKDTVRVNPGETVRIVVKFGDYPGIYPFHCHILEHEDHDMMRPFEVVAGDGHDWDDHPGRGGHSRGDGGRGPREGAGRGRGRARGPPANPGERSRGRGGSPEDRGDQWWRQDD
jgi:spore coat protein A